MMDHTETEENLDEKDLIAELDLGGSAPARSDTLERPRLQGRLPTEFHVAYSRDLLSSDIEALKLPRGTAPRSLVRIHASHHALARCLATGMKATQAALVTGYSTGRISQLVNDSAFAALVEDYRQEVKGVFADLGERMANCSLDFIELLQERREEAPESFTIPMILDVVKAFADRTGFGPGQEVHLKMDRDFIDRPPRETAEEWAARRARELGGEAPYPTKVIN